MDLSFVAFLHDNGPQLIKLQTVFQALVTAKQTNTFHDEAYWLNFFDAAAQAHFWWPTAAEQHAWLTSWQALPVEQRLTDPTLQPPWHFHSLIAAFEMVITNSSAVPSSQRLLVGLNLHHMGGHMAETSVSKHLLPHLICRLLTRLDKDSAADQTTTGRSLPVA